MEIPIALLSDFTDYSNNVKEVEVRLIEICKQHLLSLKIFESHAILEQNIFEFHEYPSKIKEKISKTITDTLTCVRILFFMSILLYKYSNECRLILEKIAWGIYKKLDLYDEETQKKTMLCFDVIENKIVNFRAID